MAVQPDQITPFQAGVTATGDFLAARSLSINLSVQPVHVMLLGLEIQKCGLSPTCTTHAFSRSWSLQLARRLAACWVPSSAVSRFLFRQLICSRSAAGQVLRLAAVCPSSKHPQPLVWALRANYAAGAIFRPAQQLPPLTIKGQRLRDIEASASPSPAGTSSGHHFTGLSRLNWMSNITNIIA